MLSADPATSGVVIIDGTVAPSVASAGVPTVPKDFCQRFGSNEGRDQLTRRWHSQPRKVLD